MPAKVLAKADSTAAMATVALKPPPLEEGSAAHSPPGGLPCLFDVNNSHRQAQCYVLG